MAEHLFPSIIHQKVEIKDFNVLTDGESFSDTPIKNKKEAYERIIEIERKKE